MQHAWVKGTTLKFSLYGPREAAKKVPPQMARPLRVGGGVKAGPLRKKKIF